jgi:hypothetical protein
MTKLWKGVLVLGATVMGLAMSAPALAVAAVGPYYAMPSWDQTLPASTRFIDLTNMPGAVLDRETGLVWEKAPSTTPFTWIDASKHCVPLSLGGRKGWRLPTIEELASLIDPTVAAPGPKLPAGHPFTVQSLDFYWSATTFAPNASGAWNVLFINGDVDFLDKSNTLLAWCVRGGQGRDAQ